MLDPKEKQVLVELKAVLDSLVETCRVGIAHLHSVGNAHPTIAQLVFKDLFQPHSV